MKRFARFVCSFLLMFLFVLFLASFATAQTTMGNTFICTQSAILDNVTATTKIISAVAATNSTILVNGTPTTVAVNSKKIRICAIVYRVVQGASPANFGLKTGTGTNCATGIANFTPQWSGTASTTDTLTDRFGPEAALVVPNGVDLCFALSAAPTKGQIEVSYAVY